MGINKNLKRNNKVKNPAGEPASVVVQNIDVRPINRTSQDIPKWRQAIQSAEAQTPRRNLIYTLYEDVVLDAHVIAVTGKRLDAVTTANWQFVNKDNEAVDVINDIIDSIGFETVVKEILNSKFWGYTILEPKFYKAHESNWEVVANLLPRRHYFPESGIVSFDGISEDGINIREGIYAKTVMEVGDVKDLGLLASAAQYAVLKRGGIGDYAMFVQVFGRPIIDATYDGTDETQRLKLKADLNIGAGGVIIRPDGTEIKVLESKGNQSTIHKDFKKDMNDEISKALLGSTETTESSDSSGYAQAETHGDSDAKKFAGDINFVRRVLNSRFIKILEAHGIETEGGKFIVDDAKELGKKETFEILSGAKEKFNLPIDDDYIYESLGIPKPDDYDQQINNRSEVEKEEDKTTRNKEPKKADKKQPEKPEEPKKKKDNLDTETDVKLNANWWQNVKDFFLKAPAKVGATNGKHHTINLSFKDTLNNEALLRRVYDSKGTLDFDVDLFEFTLKTLLKGFKKGWGKDNVELNYSTSFAYDYNDPAMLTAFELNLFRFAGAKDLALVQKLNELFRNSKNFKDFYNNASKITSVFNKDYLETEFNTAYHVGNSAANYNRLLGQVDVYPYWQYVTAEDEHVRRSHQPLHGIILHYTDPRWQQLFPPNGWNCRCRVKAVFAHDVDQSKIAGYQKKADAFLNSPAFAKEKAQGWGVNRGATGEIFTANQQYINTLKNNSSKLLNELTAVNWGLPQYSNAKKVATAISPNYNQSTQDWFNQLEKDAVTKLQDFNNRVISVQKKHVLNPKNKAELIKAIEETLKKPHEVWAQIGAENSFTYLHYYNDKTIAVKAILENLELTVKEWADLETNKDLIKLFRKGLLVKK